MVPRNRVHFMFPLKKNPIFLDRNFVVVVVVDVFVVFFRRRSHIHAKPSHGHALAAVASPVSPASSYEVSWFCVASSAKNRTPRFFTRSTTGRSRFPRQPLKHLKSHGNALAAVASPCHPQPPTKCGGCSAR